MLSYFDLGFTLSETNFLPPRKSPEQAEDFSLNKLYENNDQFILIFSSDRDTRFLFKTALEMWNFNAVEAGSVEEFVCLTENKSFDLVLMDTEFLFSESIMKMKMLRTNAALKDVPFILLSGHAQKAVRELAMANGSAEFFVKPVDFIKLESAINTHLKKVKQTVSGGDFG